MTGDDDAYEAQKAAFREKWAAYREKFKGDPEDEARHDEVEKSREAYWEIEAACRKRLSAARKREDRKHDLLERIAKQLEAIQELVRDMPYGT